jgi:tetratricopeptide (TPR) repeat protein
MVPLTNVLGYESAAIMGVAVSIGVVLHHFLERKKYPLSPIFDREEGSLVAFVRRFLLYCGLLIPAFVIMWGNSFRIPNCTPLIGVYFWLCIPVVSILITQSLCLVGSCLLPSYGWLLGLLFLSVNATSFLWRLAWEPLIMGYSWSFGWFAGSIYDEALSFPSALLMYRIYCVLLAFTLVLAVDFRWRIRQGFYLRWSGLSLTVMCVLTVFVFSHRVELGFHQNQSSVQKTLGGKLETTNFIAYFDPGSIDLPSQKWLEDDLEFRYWELQQFFNEDPVKWRGKKIEVFIYPNRAVQYQLMGSRRTLVARPWTHQMHVRWHYGSTALSHEMAHLFTAPFGSGPLKISTHGGIVPNLGLLEGIAVAADWPEDDVTSHEVAAALHKLKKAPKLLNILEPQGFWAQPAGKAYELMGSFVRWLYEVHGIEKLKLVYANSNFTEVYGKNLEELHTEWFEFITSIDVDNDTVQLVNYRYDRKSIFAKICARSMAEEERLANVAIALGQFEEAIKHIEKMIEWNPKDWRAQYQLANTFVEWQRFEDAQAIIVQQLNNKLTASQRANFQELLLDIHWQNGNYSSAIDVLDLLNTAEMSSSKKRRITVKEYFLNKSSSGEYFFADMSTAQRLWQVSKIANDGIIEQYLLLYNLFLIDQYQDVVQKNRPILPDTLQGEMNRIIMLSYWFLEDLDKVETMLGILQSTDDRKLQLISIEYNQRLRWKRERL